jgi:pimeloyl-ACP methyl ester carboxylesterase
VPGIFLSEDFSFSNTGSRTFSYQVRINRATTVASDEIGFLLTGASQPQFLTITRDPLPETSALIDPTSLLRTPGVDLSLPAVQDIMATSQEQIAAIGADGVTEVVARIPADFKGQSFTFHVFNENHRRSTSVAEDGGLAAVGSSNFSNNVTILAVDTNSAGPTVFFLYKAPQDFPRSPVGRDDAKVTRTIFIQQDCDCDSTFALQVLRPPVVLVHGLWSEPATWDSFSPLIQDIHFDISRVALNRLVGSQLLSSTPTYSDSVLRKATSDALGVTYNAQQLDTQLGLFLDWFRSGKNRAGVRAAATQVDVVAHSMGGIVARAAVFDSGFYSAENFNQGKIHKLITIGSPHFGSPLASRLLEDGSFCVRNRLAKIGNLSFETVNLSGTQMTGAVGDMKGNGFGGQMSQVLVDLANFTGPPLRTATIAGLADLQALGSGNLIASFIQASCNDLLAPELNAEGWQTIFNQDNDGLVSKTSQLAATTGFVFSPFTHSDSLLLLGFSRPFELQGDTDISQKVIVLLNTPISSTDFVPLPNLPQ